MTKSFLTATALVALLGFGVSGAMAQQSAPTLNAPAIEKTAPVVPGKTDAGKSGAVQHKSGSTAAAKPIDSKAKRDAAAACATVKEKAAHDACMKAHASNAKAPAANQKAATPDKSKVTPRVGG